MMEDETYAEVYGVPSDATWNLYQVTKILKAHALSSALPDFLAEHGKRDRYSGHAVMAWLGY